MALEAPYERSHFFSLEAVATDSYECSKIGEQVLADGGNAVDSAVASLFCLEVMNPHSSGVFGGGFMLIKLNASEGDSSSVVFDFREQSPKCTQVVNNTSIVKTVDASSEGGLAIAIPGEVAGMFKAWQSFGSMDWNKLVDPSIKLLRHGFKVGKSFAVAMDRWRDKIASVPSLRKYFSRNGERYKEGELFKNVNLANFLEQHIKQKHANDRVDTRFYSSSLTDEFVKEIKKHGGCANKNDFASYNVHVNESIIVSLKNGQMTLTTAPAPTSGPVLALVLSVFDMLIANDKQKLIMKNNTIKYHYIIECLKYGYAFRQFLGDPAFESIVKNQTDKILKPASITMIFNDIISNKNKYRKNNANYFVDFIKKILFSTPLQHPNRQTTQQTQEQSVSDDFDVDCKECVKTSTTHLVVMDKYKNLVSVTSTINSYFGSKLASDKFGFVYNNQMDDFCFPSNFSNVYNMPSNPINYPKFGKRPQSSAAPVVIMEGDSPKMVIGASGGTLITSAVFQVIVNYIYGKMTLKQALDEPRLHHQLTPFKTFAELRFSRHTFRALEKLGHKMEYNEIHHAVVQAISVADDDFEKTLSRSSICQISRSIRLRNDKKHKSRREDEKCSIIQAESDFRKGGRPSGL